MCCGEQKQVGLGSGLSSTRYKQPATRPCLTYTFLISKMGVIIPLPLG